jgi:hypothetical protein
MVRLPPTSQKRVNETTSKGFEGAKPPLKGHGGARTTPRPATWVAKTTTITFI